MRWSSQVFGNSAAARKTVKILGTPYLIISYSLYNYSIKGCSSGHPPSHYTARQSKTDLPEEKKEAIRRHEGTGGPLGNAGFLNRLEKMINRSLKKQKPGPKKKN